MQPGHMPPVSKVFHTWPQVQPQRSFAHGRQAQTGQRIPGPDVPPPSPIFVEISGSKVVADRLTFYSGNSAAITSST